MATAGNGGRSASKATTMELLVVRALHQTGISRESPVKCGVAQTA
jgi:hypothetical protein